MSLCDRVAHLFQAKPDRWIDGREFAALGGYAAWRTRISELRRPPYGMTIENRVRRIRNSRGTQFTVTEYRFVSEKKVDAPVTTGV